MKLQLLSVALVALLVPLDAASVRGNLDWHRNLQSMNELTALDLINAQTDTKHSTLVNNQVVVVSAIPGMTSPNFNINATYNLPGPPGSVSIQSVVFSLNGVVVQTENAAPWAFCGNNGPNFNTCGTLGTGTHTVTATPFASKNGAGAPGRSVTVTFIVASLPPVRAPTKTPTKAPIAAPTVAPMAPTNAPKSPTNAPKAPTNAPKAPTNAPKAPTNAPKSPTSAPKAPTPAPKAPTNAPKAPTTAPKAPTNAPKAPTDAPKAPTNAPKAPTNAPKAPTNAPKAPTTGPKAPTNAPKAPTNAPKAPTDAPKAPTDAPKAPTTAPKAPTNAPKAPTNAPMAPPISILVNCGGSDHVDALGQTWMTDQYFSGGNTYCTGNGIANTNDDPIYQCERYGNVIYAIPLPSRSYSVTVHFAEIYHDNANSRKFNVSVGSVQYPDIDLVALVGKNHAYTITTNVIVTNGRLDIVLTTILDQAKISAIEIHSSGPAPPSVPTPAPVSGPTAPTAQCPIPQWQGIWTSSKSYPISVAEAGGAMVGTTLVIVSGFTDNWSRTVLDTYGRDTSTSNSNWVRYDDQPVAIGTTHSGFVVVNNKFYMCGGYVGANNGPISNICMVLDISQPSGQQWSTTAVPPLPEGHGGGGMVYDTEKNALIVAGGALRFVNNGPIVDTDNTWMYSFDTPSVGWVEKAPIPYTGNHISFVTAKDADGVEHHYFNGGQQEEKEENGNKVDHVEYVAANDTWVVRQSLLVPRGHASSSTRPYGCGYILMGGCTNGGGRVNEISYYHIPTNTWHPMDFMPYGINTPVCDINRSNNIMYCQTGHTNGFFNFQRQLMPL